MLIGVIFLGILLVGLFWYLFFYQGESKRIKYRSLIRFAIALFGLASFVMFYGAFKYSSGLSFWFYLETGLILFIFALALYLAVHDYESATQDLEELQYYQEKKRLNQNKEEDEGENKENLLYAALSTEDLLVMKEKFKSNKSFVKMIDDVLEARTKKFQG